MVTIIIIGVFFFFFFFLRRMLIGRDMSLISYADLRCTPRDPNLPLTGVSNTWTLRESFKVFILTPTNYFFERSKSYNERMFFSFFFFFNVYMIDVILSIRCVKNIDIFFTANSKLFLSNSCMSSHLNVFFTQYLNLFNV